MVVPRLAGLLLAMPPVITQDVRLHERVDLAEAVARAITCVERDTDASYCGKFQVDRLTLERGTREQLTASPFPTLAARIFDDEGDVPILVGEMRVQAGREVFAVEHRLLRRPTCAIAYHDGHKSLELVSDSHATLWERATEAGIIGLPWLLVRIGQQRVAPILRAAQLQANLTASLDGSTNCVSILVTNAPSGGLPAEVRLVVGLGPIGADDRVVSLSAWQDGVRLSGVELRDHIRVGDALLARSYVLCVTLPGTSEGQRLEVGYHGSIEYTEDGPDPQEVLERAEHAAEIKTGEGTLFPVAGVTKTIDAVVKCYPLDADPDELPVKFETDSGPAKRLLCVRAKPQFPDLKTWYQQRLAEGVFLSRKGLSEAYCLQFACALVLRWQGRGIDLANLLETYPDKALSIKSGLQLLESSGAPHVAIEAPLSALAACRDPFIVMMRSQDDEPAHAIAMLNKGKRTYAWQVTSRLMATTHLSESKVSALVSKRDHDKIK